MPLLAAWLGSLFSSTVAWLTLYVSKKIALTLAAIAAIVAITATFIAGINALIAGVSYAAPAELGIAWGWLVPDNFDDCVAALLAAHSARWVYDWNTKVIQMKLL